MQITITINCDNAAFEDQDIATEAIRILRQQAIPAISDGKDLRVLYDINGNVVGMLVVAFD